MRELLEESLDKMDRRTWRCRLMESDDTRTPQLAWESATVGQLDRARLAMLLPVVEDAYETTPSLIICFGGTLFYREWEYPFG
jgi:hypothetical protein